MTARKPTAEDLLCPALQQKGVAIFACNPDGTVQAWSVEPRDNGHPVHRWTETVLGMMNNGVLRRPFDNDKGDSE